MSDPAAATTGRGGDRYYTWRQENFWSVTTIIKGGTPKWSLINWAKKFTAQYAIDNYAKLGHMLEPNPKGVVDEEGALAWLKDASYRHRDAKAALGTHVHKAIEAHTLGKPFPPWPPPVAARMKSFERFLAKYEPHYLATEASVFSRRYRYAGTLDAIFVITKGPHKGREFIVDYKTGGKDVYPETALQLAAYRHADFIGLPDGSERAMYNPDDTACLWLPDEETGEVKLVRVVTDEEVFKAFLHVREVYRWSIETSKTVLLGEVAYEGDPFTTQERALDDELQREARRPDLEVVVVEELPEPSPVQGDTEEPNSGSSDKQSDAGGAVTGASGEVEQGRGTLGRENPAQLGLEGT
jgi:hypothetical protein